MAFGDASPFAQVSYPIPQFMSHLRYQVEFQFYRTDLHKYDYS